MKHYSCAWQAFIIILVTLFSCKGHIENNPDAICVTAEATNITETTAILHGYANLTSDMTGSVELGFLISEESTPSLKNGFTAGTRELNPDNSFALTIKSLSPNTLYYYKAYVLRNNIYMYGEIKSFKTNDLNLSVLTLNATNVGTKSATLNGSYSIKSNDEFSIQTGFYYGKTESSPEELKRSGKCVICSSSGSQFSKQIDNLDEDSDYFFVAFVSVFETMTYGSVLPLRTASNDIILNASSFDVGYQGGDFSLVAVSSIRPTISNVPSWITISSGAYSNNTISYTLSVAKNTQIAIREADLVITSGNITKTVKVTQGPQDGIQVSPKRIEVEAKASYGHIVTVNASNKPTLSNVPNWITVSEGNYLNYCVQFSIDIGENLSENTRSATITFSIDGFTESLSIIQEPKKADPRELYNLFKIPSNEEDRVARAFPGAEGGGMYVTGGRGGKVYHVTSLNDNTVAGTLRYGIEKESRPLTIVFDVAGIIELQKALKITTGNLTIAGQTAPGDGICLKNYNFRIHASNVIVRYIRCRMGDEKQTEDDAMNLYTGDNDLRDVIIDHCSLSWSTDECGSFYGMTNFSLQWCILSESLRNSIHGKGKHSYGGIWGGTNATFHHNLLAHNDSRNPRLDHDYVSTLKGPVSLINNVIYNWGDNSTYGGESANDENIFKRYNVINNYYKPGPATESGKVRFIDPWAKECSNCSSKTGSSTIVPGHFYLAGNVMHGDDGKTLDNWTGTTASTSLIAVIKSSQAFTSDGGASRISLQKASKAFVEVLDYSGASFRRDAVDTRIVKETQSGTYTYNGSNGSTNGFIDTQSDVGGWPSYRASSNELSNNNDTDRDGIPDWFEVSFGLNKNDASDASKIELDLYGRYTNLEMYLHYLVRDLIANQNEGGEYISL